MSQLLSIALDEIRESPLNPRKSFDGDKLTELSESIKAHGLLQPLVVRAIAKGGRGRPAKANHEIVCGARRFRAAKLAGLSEVPVVVRELDDDQALECMVIENLQRSDIDPLDEADGFKALQDRGLDLATIGAKVGKPERFVFQRLKLATLSEHGRKLMAEDALPIGQALLVCQLGQADQDQLLRSHYASEWNRPRTIADLGRIIGRDFIRQLDKAPFDVSAADLLPQAGACANCPKNTSFNPNLFAGTEGDRTGLCTDKACWRQKGLAAAEARLKDALEKNPEAQKLSTDWNKKTKGVMPSGDWREVEKGKDTHIGVIVDSDDPGKIGKVVRFKSTKTTSGSTGTASGGGALTEKSDEELEKKRERKEELRQLRVDNLSRHRVFEACVAALESGPRLLSGPLAKAALVKLLERTNHYAKGIADIHGPSFGEFIEKVRQSSYSQRGTPTCEQVKDRTPEPDTAEFDLWLLAALANDEVPVSDFHRPSGYGLFAAAETLGIDVDLIRKEADYELMSKKQKAEHDKAKAGAE